MAAYDEYDHEEPDGSCFFCDDEAEEKVSDVNLCANHLWFTQNEVHQETLLEEVPNLEVYIGV